MLISATSRVKAGIESRIVDGSLAPGTILDEARLSKMFDVSRTPVREALLELSVLGFVCIVPRLGIYVVRLSARELESLFEVLAQSEALCAKLAINRINEEQLVMLRDLQAVGQKAVEDGDIHGFTEYNKSFHEFFYRCCGNTYLVEQIILIRKRINPYRLRNEKYVDRIAKSWAEHDALLTAVLAKDEHAAAYVASQHIMAMSRESSLLLSADPADLVFESQTAYGAKRSVIDMPRVPIKNNLKKNDLPLPLSR